MVIDAHLKVNNAADLAEYISRLFPKYKYDFSYEIESGDEIYMTIDFATIYINYVPGNLVNLTVAGAPEEVENRIVSAIKAVLWKDVVKNHQASVTPLVICKGMIYNLYYWNVSNPEAALNSLFRNYDFEDQGYESVTVNYPGYSCEGFSLITVDIPEETDEEKAKKVIQL